MKKYKIKVINGNKNINEIFIELLNKTISNKNEEILKIQNASKIPRVGGNNNKR